MAQMYSKKFIGINIGDTFNSFEEVKERMTYVQECSQVPLLLRDCVTLKGAVKKRPYIAVMANPALEYHSLHYICVCGRNDAQRIQTYIRLGISPEYLCKEGERCPVLIRFGLTADYQQLEVKRINHVHNHKISQKLYKIMALSKIVPTETEDASSKSGKNRKRKILNMQALPPELENLTTASRRKTDIVYEVKKKEVADDYEFESIMNVMPLPAPRTEPSSNRKGGHARRIAFKHLVEELYSVESAICEVYEEGMKPYAVFFQTEDMAKNFSFYPDVLLIDSKFEIHAIRMKLLVLMCADGNGECSIVGLCFVTQLSAKVITFLMEMFLKYNPNCSQTQSVALDRSLNKNHRIGILSHLPHAAVFMCYHHVIRAYKEEVPEIEDLQFENEEEKDICNGLFRKMISAEDSSTYYRHFHRFKLYAPARLHNYFIINWHRKTEEWVNCMKPSHSSFLNPRYNQMMEIDRSFTSVCNSFQSVSQFFQDVMKTVISLQLEKKQRALLVPVKGPVVTSPFHIAETRYKNYLTPYASSIVQKQMKSSSSVKIVDNVDDDTCIIKSPKYGELSTTTVFCSCKVFAVVKLPCSHIFAVRNEKGLHAYDTTLCGERWSMRYIRKCMRLNLDDSDLVPDSAFGSQEDSLAEIRASKPDDVNGMVESDNVPFVPSCVAKLGDEDNQATSQAVCDEDLVVSEVQSGGILNLVDEDKVSEEPAPSIDWVDMLETL